MLETYADLKNMMIELEKANLNPNTKILFGDSDSNSYNVSKATIVPLADVLDYDCDFEEDEKEDRKGFSKEKCIFFEVE